jgi:hypothetical protein
VGGGVESCCRRLDTGDATDRVGVLAPIEGGLRERATEELLLAREIMLALENELCELICCINPKLSSKDNLHSGQRGCLGDSW